MLPPMSLNRAVSRSRPRCAAVPALTELGPVVALVGVQARPVDAEKGAAVKLVGATLGSHLQIGAAEAAILGVVAVGGDLDVVDRVLVGRDDGRSAPHRRGRADAVN